MLRTSLVLVGTTDSNLAKLSSIELTIYNPIIVLVKVSILLQYITLFVVHRGTFFHYFVHVLIWTNIFYYTLTTLLFIFEVSFSFLLPLVVRFDEMKTCLREKSVHLDESFGIRQSLGIASVRIRSELHLAPSMLSRTC